MTYLATVNTERIDIKDVLDWFDFEIRNITRCKLISKMGLYTRGKNKGKIKGALMVVKADDRGQYKGKPVHKGQIVEIRLCTLEYQPSLRLTACIYKETLYTL